jgi:hypothetical protein
VLGFAEQERGRGEDTWWVLVATEGPNEDGTWLRAAPAVTRWPHDYERERERERERETARVNARNLEICCY